MQRYCRIARLVFAALSAIALVTACNSAVSTAISMPAPATVHGKRPSPLDAPSAVVRVFDNSAQTIYGTVTSASCISASPSPLPTIGSDTHKEVTLTYLASCGASPSIDIAYGSGAQYYTCTLVVTYEAATFKYSVNNEPAVACYAKPGPGSAGFDEGFYYTPCLSNCFSIIHRRH
jgi:hypothetical protein